MTAPTIGTIIAPDSDIPPNRQRVNFSAEDTKPALTDGRQGVFQGRIGTVVVLTEERGTPATSLLSHYQGVDIRQAHIDAVALQTRNCIPKLFHPKFQVRGKLKG